MSKKNHFKQILEIEKKYEHILSNAHKHYEKEVEKFKEEIDLREVASKEDYKKELNRELRKIIEQNKKKGAEVLKKAKNEAKHVYEQAKREDAKQFLMEAIKNV